MQSSGCIDRIRSTTNFLSSLIFSFSVTTSIPSFVFMMHPVVILPPISTMHILQAPIPLIPFR